MKNILLKIQLILFLCLVANVQLKAQCGISATPDVTVIDCNDSINVNLVGYSDTLLGEMFGPQGPTDPGWTQTAGAIYTNPYIPSPTNDTYFWMGATAVLPAQLVTTDYDLSLGGRICYDMVYAGVGGAAPIEQPDLFYEGVSLQYSTDGGVTWQDIVYLTPFGDTLTSNPGPGGTGNNLFGAGPFEQWTNFCWDIPVGAQTNGVRFRWIQTENSGACCDHWGLDNINILSQGQGYAYFDENWNFIDTNNFGVYPTTDSTFTYYLTNGLPASLGGDTCSSTFTISVNPTDAGPDLVACETRGIQINTSGVAPWGDVSWSPGITLDDSTNANPFANPAVDTEYFLTSDCGVDSVTVFVEDDFSVTMSIPDTICVNGATPLSLTTTPSSVTIDGISWSNAQSLSSDSGFQVLASPVTTTEYVATVSSDSGCVVQDSVVVHVQGLAAVLSTSPFDTTICLGDSVAIEATPSGEAYTVTSINHTPYPTTGGTPFGAFTDDNVQGPLGFSFNFPFFGSLYDEIYLSSNGWFSFTSTTNSSLGNAVIPATPVPNNIIAWAWDDLNFNTSGSFTYYEGGTAPNRYIVLNFINVSHFGGGGTVDVQVVLYENGLIEIHNIDVQSDGGTMTQGIENSTGTVGYPIPGSNNTVFDSQGESWAFIPYTAPVNAVYNWTPNNTLNVSTGQNVVATPLETTTYTVEMVEGFCRSFASVTVNVPAAYVNIVEDSLVLCDIGDTVVANLVVDSLKEASCLRDYNLTQVPFYLETPTGAVTNFSFDSDDDGETNQILMPIPFQFYCEDVDFFIAQTNGVLNLIDNGFANDDYTNQTFPNNSAPNGIIAMMWDDLTAAGNTSSYFVNGSAPNRKLVIDYNLRHLSTGPQVVGQIILHEGTNIIDISCENCIQDNAPSATQGIKSQDGNEFVVVPGRNNSTWSSINETWRFTPDGLGQTYTTLWSPVDWVSDINGDTVQIVTPQSQYYEVAVTTSFDNCVYYDSVYVGLQGLVTSPDISICPGDSASIEVFNATNVVWTPDNGSISDVNSLNPTVYPSSTTTYEVAVTQGNCNLLGSVLVEVAPLSTPIINGGLTSVATCLDEPVVLFSDADPANTNTWTGPEQGSGTGITVNTSGTYTLTTSSIAGCEADASIEVSIANPGVLNTDDIRNVLCCNDAVTIAFSALSSNGADISEIYWNGNTSPVVGTVTLSSGNDGIYDIRTVDVNGCESTTQFEIETVCNEVEVQDVDSLIIGTTHDYVVNTTLLYDEETWYPQAVFTNNVFSANISGENIVYVNIFNNFVLNNGSEYSCVVSDSSSVYVISISDPEMPDAFSPNGDGLNDNFFPVNLDPNSTIQDFVIYNRWGEEVYRYNNDNGWDGKWRDEDQPVDTYTYYLNIDKTTDNYIQTGTLTLIR